MPNTYTRTRLPKGGFRYAVTGTVYQHGKKIEYEDQPILASSKILYTHIVEKTLQFEGKHHTTIRPSKSFAAAIRQCVTDGHVIEIEETP